MTVVGKVGEIEISRIYEMSLLGFTAQQWFPKFDREALRPHEHWLCPTFYDAETGRFPMSVSSWLFRIGGNTVLVDSCIGNGKNFPDLPEMHQLDTRYLERLATAGVRLEEVDYVLCTHLHVDHVGWNTRLVDGRWVPTFPNARHVIARREYEGAKQIAFDVKSPDVLRTPFMQSVLPVMETGQVVLVDDGHELLDALRLIPMPGHSPGHIRIELRSGGALGVFAGDLVHSPIQIPFWEWSTVQDWNQDMAATSRRDLLRFCRDEDALLIPGHFEHPYAGRIRSDGEGFRVELGW